MFTLTTFGELCFSGVVAKVTSNDKAKLLGLFRNCEGLKGNGLIGVMCLNEFSPNQA